MRVLGIDPGLRTTGFGVVDCAGGRLRYVASGTIRTAAVAMADLPGRLKVIFDGVREIAARYAPTCASVEIVFVNVNPQATLLLGQARGAALSALVADELAVAEYTALQMKRAIVGHGQAKKEQVQQMVMRLLATSERAGARTPPTRSAWRSATPTPRAPSPPSAAAPRSRRARRGATGAGEHTDSAHPAMASAGPGRESSGDNRRPMNALFEDGGKFHVGRVMSETDTSLQIELASGKRSQGQGGQRAAALRAARPRDAARERRAARGRASTSIWPGNSRPKASSRSPSWRATTSARRQASASKRRRCCACSRRRTISAASARVGSARRPRRSCKAALLGIEKKEPVRGAGRRVGRRAGSRAACPARGARAALPDPVQARQELARVQGGRRGGAPPGSRAARPAASRQERSTRRTSSTGGASCSSDFPKGTGFAAVAVPRLRDELPLAPAQAFSIDDSQTTEIDDALSVQGLGSGKVTVGIHIAAPALAFAPETPVDQIARDRLSTVYIPGHKLTMLPEAVVDAFTLAEGRDAPAVSLYVDGRRGDPRDAGERNPPRARADRRQPAPRRSSTQVINDETLRNRPARARCAFGDELTFLHAPGEAAQGASASAVRGKPENFNRPDYSFRARRRRRPADQRRRARDDRAAAARRAARPDRRRGDDPGQQHLGRLARGVRRSRHLPQPGEPRARHQGAHGHAARRRTPASASRSTPGRRRRCAATSISSTSGRSSPCARHGRSAAARGTVQAQGRRSCSPIDRRLRRAYAALQRVPGADRALLVAALPAAERRSPSSRRRC